MYSFMNYFWKIKKISLFDNYNSDTQGLHYCHISSHIGKKLFFKIESLKYTVFVF